MDLAVAAEVRKFIERHWRESARQGIVKEELGYDAGNWRTFAELGWLGVPFSEEDGGFDGTAIESIIMCEQFGQPIGKFQVLQHRMVDMFMEHEQAKSLMYMAAMRMDEGYGPEARKAVSACKVQVGTSGRFVGQNAVQLHGGMGMTDELRVGHYFKRLTMIDTLFGNVDHHLERFGSL